MFFSALKMRGRGVEALIRHKDWRKRGGIIGKTVQSNTIKIGNTTFYVTSVFSGTVDLQHLIKRLIQKEIEQENNGY